MTSPGTDIWLHFVRHGQSEANLRSDLIGGTSPFSPLTRLGQDQAKSVGQRLKNQGITFDGIFSSPTQRTKQTARIICEQLELSPRIIRTCKSLIEIDEGEWSGRPRSECHTPEMLERMNLLAQDFAPPGGESQRQVGKRMFRWLEDVALTDGNVIRGAHPTHILTVSHSMAIKCLLHAIFGFDARFIWRWEIGNCSMSVIRFTARGWFPVCINDTGHLVGVG